MSEKGVLLVCTAGRDAEPLASKGASSGDGPAAVSEVATGTVGRESLIFYIALALLATAGFFYVNIMPALVDGLITGLHFSPLEAGWVASANVYGASVGCLAAVFLVRRVPWKPALLVLFGVLILLDVGSILIHQALPLILVRAAHGLIGGSSVGIALAVIARTRAPDRGFGMLLFVQFGLGGVAVMWLPRLVPMYGAGVLFVALAVLTSLAAVTTAFLSGSAIGEVGTSDQRSKLGGQWLLLALILGALFLFQWSNMTLSAFVIGLGEARGLSRALISSTLGWATWIGALGSIAVVILGNRRGRAVPLFCAMLITLGGTAAFFWSELGAIYFAANTLTAITWSFVVPYLFGMASQLDRSGRLASLSGFASKLGLATGPWAAGLLVRSGDFGALITAALIGFVLAAMALLIAARRLDTWNH